MFPGRLIMAIRLKRKEQFLLKPQTLKGSDNLRSLASPPLPAFLISIDGPASRFPRTHLTIDRSLLTGRWGLGTTQTESRYRIRSLDPRSGSGRCRPFGGRAGRACLMWLIGLAMLVAEAGCVRLGQPSTVRERRQRPLRVEIGGDGWQSAQAELPWSRETGRVDMETDDTARRRTKWLTKTNYWSDMGTAPGV